MKPILCNYYITYRCNLNCSYCDIVPNAKFNKTVDCSFEKYEKNLSDLKSIGIKFIDFTGGEPLLHNKLNQMLMLAKKRKFKTSVTTNCLLYPEKAEELKGLIDLLHFSLDSLNEKQNDEIRGKHSFSKVMESIAIAKELKERPDLLFTVTEKNLHSIEDMCKFAFDQHLILIVNPVFTYSDQSIITAEMLDYIEQFKNKPFVYMNQALHRLIRTGGNKRAEPRCRAVTSTIVISPENELLLPCFHHYHLSVPIRSNLKKLVNSKIIVDFKKQDGTHPQCEGCTINCYFDPSFLYKIDKYFWLSLKSKIKYGYFKYIRI